MKLSLFARYGMGMAVLFLLTHCQKINPQPPKAEGFDPALKATDSYVTGSLRFGLRQLENKINQELDPVLVGKGSPGGKRGGVFPFRLARLGRVRVKYVNQQVRFSTPLQLWIVKPFSADKTPPDEPFCSLNVDFQSPLRVTPNWRLASKVQFTNYNWIKEPEIRLLGQRIPLTNLAEDVLERYKSGIESAIDTAIYKELRLDQIVQPIWKGIQKPLRIDRQYGLWLLPRPVAVDATSIDGDSTTIISHLGITVATKTVLQVEEPAHSPTPLPVLNKRDQLPAISSLNLMSAIPYTDISRVLNQTLGEKGKRLAMGMLTVKNVSVYGGQRSLIVKAQVQGLLDGIVYLRGRPEFDTLSNTLTVKNLDFDTGTKDILPKMASSIVHKGLLKLLSSMLTVPLGDDIARFPAKISEAFAKGSAGKKTSLNLKNFRFIPQQIAIRPNGIQTLIRVESKVDMVIKKL